MRIFLREKRNSNNLAFTLVEILVVIAVTGLLSSIIFAVIQGADDQGRIGKNLYFSQHLQNSLGSYAVGMWRFDEGSGTTVNDTSGWGNNGTIIGGASFTDDTPHKAVGSGEGKYALSFGSNKYVDAGSGSSLRMGDNFTWEAWVKANTLGANRAVMGYFTGGSSCGGYGGVNLDIYSDNTIWIRYGDTSGVAHEIHVGSYLKTNTWYHIVLVFSSSGGKIYVNGSPIDRTFTAACPSSWAPFQIGKNFNNGYYWDGVIDEVFVYDTVLTSTQIRFQYYAGLQNLLARNQISGQEYQERSAMY
jgi:large repetitive protein